MSQYPPIEEHPEEIEINKYWKPGNGMWYLREALSVNHEENLWNWFRRTYPNLNPSLYGIKDPVVEEFEYHYEEFKNSTREELIREIIDLRKAIEKFC